MTKVRSAAIRAPSNELGVADVQKGTFYEAELAEP